MVLSGDGDVAHSRFFRQQNPLVGVELNGVELLHQLLILVDGDLSVVHDPLADTGDALAFPLTCRDGVKTPMDEHAELCLSPPSKPVRLRLLSSRHSSKQNPPHLRLTSIPTSVVQSKL